MRHIAYTLAQKAGLYLPSRPSHPVIVTGTHRGGSTFIGTVMAEDDDLRWVYEPLAPDFDNLGVPKNCEICGLDISYVYQFLNPNGARKDQKAHFKHYINSKALLGKDALFKAPECPFATEWLAKTYNARVLFMVRSPLSFVASCKKQGWGVDFNDLLKQKELVDEYVPKYKEQMKELTQLKKRDFLKENTLLWNIVYDKLIELEKQYPEWVVYRLEDLTNEPEKGFKDIFKRLGLNYNQKVAAKVEELTNANNKAETTAGVVHSLHRDSKKNANLWKDRLTTKEVEYVLKHTQEVGKHYYPEMYKKRK